MCGISVHKSCTYLGEVVGPEVVVVVELLVADLMVLISPAFVLLATALVH